MKRTLWILAATLTLAAAHAATNDLTSLLQKGLFEEEANRNLDGAISNYQSLATAFDKDRQVAATAIFRLGECYRKLGRTNEAAAQYQRIVNDFSDQQTLVTLSRQNLTGMARSSGNDTGPSFSDRVRVLIQEAQTGTNGSFTEKVRQLIEQETSGSPTTMAAQNFHPQPAITDEEEKEIRRIQSIIQNSPDLINAPSGDPSLTPLGRAASQGQLRVAKFLLEAKAQVNQTTSGMTPLQHAASRGHRAMVELLLANGADVNAKGSGGRTALHSAAERGFVSVTETLITAKANLNALDDGGSSPLNLAVQTGFRAVAELLLAHGADPNIITLKPPQNFAPSESSQGAPLHFAARREDEPMVALLLKNHADTSLLSPFNKTALDIAAEKGSLEIVRDLLEVGANPNPPRPNSEDLTPLYRAVNQGNLAVVNLLLEKGADPNQTTYWGGRSGMTPLLQAIVDGNEQIAAALLQNKADPNQVNGEGNSPLMLVAQSDKFTSPEKRINVAKLLLAKGADINAKGPLGYTPLHLAVQYKRPELVGFLLASHADVNVENTQGQTPLSLAKQQESGSTVGSQPGPLPIARSQMIPRPSSPEPRPISQETKLTTLLRQHGALDELPDFSAIRATRQGLSGPINIFWKSTNDWNRFTLLTTVLNTYSGEYVWIGNAGYLRESVFQFPDFKRILVHRPIRATPGKEQVISVDFLNSTNGIDCTKDQQLEFGDIVEIPEREHALGEKSVGLTDQQKQQILACLLGTAKLVVRGKTVDITLFPFESAKIGAVLGSDAARAVLMVSSDLAHVKVTRRDAVTGKKQEWTLDCSDLSKAPDLWLRDGDIVEVPEK